MKFLGRSKRKSSEEPSHIPHESFDEGKRVWFESYGAPSVNANRWFIASMVLGAMVIVLTITIHEMMPLKTVVPYIVKVDDSGYVSADPAAAQQYQPGDPEKRYFIAKWVRQLYTIQHALTVSNLKNDYALLDGPAVHEFADWIRQDDPIGKLTQNSEYFRTVEINSVNFVSSSTALVRFTTKVIGADGHTVQNGRKERIATIEFEIVPPNTASEILFNPIGLHITNFDITEDVNKESQQ